MPTSESPTSTATWPSWLARGGEVLAPGPAGDPAWVFDGRDMAAWVEEATLLAEGVDGSMMPLRAGGVPGRW